DPAFVALPVLAVVAGAVGNKRTIRLKSGWEEPSVIWAVTIGESGSLKSPALHRAVAPQLSYQREREDDYRAQQDWYEKQLGDHKSGPKPTKPVSQRVLVSDITVEKLVEVLKDNPGGVLLWRDELSAWLGSFSRYKGKAGGSDLPYWLEANRAGPWVYDR